jgi:hypothetical protein
MNMFDVVLLKSISRSFAWNDGLFAVQKIENDTYYLWKIKEGKLDMIDGKTPNITCTSIRNKGVNKTNMKISI